jgi:hypothetical protein
MGDFMTSTSYPFSEAQWCSIRTLYYNYGLWNEMQDPYVNGEHSADFWFHWWVVQGVESNALQAQIRQFGTCALSSTFLGC